MLSADLIDALAPVFGGHAALQRVQPVGIGSINRAFRLDTASGRYFVKINTAQRRTMFEQEAAGLGLLAPHIRVPGVVAQGHTESSAYLLLDWLDLSPVRDGARLGEALAGLHQHTAEQHGWMADNTIGTTPQRNDWRDDAVAFWRDCRLQPQFALAARNGLRLPKSDILLTELGALYGDYCPVASCLHGDLWSGNVGELADGTPVLYDPAPYFSDRESDLAMTELFGGFGRRFREAYVAAWPLDPGYRVRRNVYQLYHVLNHFNLFGGSYAADAKSLLDMLCAELR
ncbi:fructosamine kinase family protein [Chitinibacteraceae bacterium HSL-7]